jgi:hypothetical protein
MTMRDFFGAFDYMNSCRASEAAALERLTGVQ